MRGIGFVLAAGEAGTAAAAVPDMDSRQTTMGIVVVC